LVATQIFRPASADGFSGATAKTISERPLTRVVSPFTFGRDWTVASIHESLKQAVEVRLVFFSDKDNSDEDVFFLRMCRKPFAPSSIAGQILSCEDLLLDRERPLLLLKKPLELLDGTVGRVLFAHRTQELNEQRV
jgi:hypothetical protein